MRVPLEDEEIETQESQESVNVRPQAQRGVEVSGRIGRYQLRRKLGAGTFAQVYAAYDDFLDREVALKVLNQSHLANIDIVQRFHQEGRAAAKIRHPGIVAVHDCGITDGSTGISAYIAMEMLEGESLASRLARSGKLTIAQTIEIARQIASALDAAHRAGVLHRDLTPDNIFLVPDPAAVPSGERVKVIDFGLAKIGAGDTTQLEMVFGTPAYMSPEQCKSSGEIDQRSDVYALGCILFELVCGRAPFEGGMREIMGQHLRTPALRASSFTPEVPFALEELIASMLAKDPGLRPQSMAAVQQALYDAGAISPGVQATLMPAALAKPETLPPAVNLAALQALLAQPPPPEPIDSTSQIQFEPVVAPIDPAEKTQYPRKISRPSRPSRPTRAVGSSPPTRRSMPKPAPKRRPAWDARSLTAMVRTAHRRRRTLAAVTAAAIIVIAAALASFSLLSRSHGATLAPVPHSAPAKG